MPSLYGSGPYGLGLYGSAGTPLTFTIQIASVTYDIKEGSFDFNPIIEQRSKLTFTVLDPNNAFNFVKGQVITLTDSASTIQFTGTVHTSIKYKVGDGNLRQHDIDCNDLHQVADERTTNRIYTNQYAGVIFAGMTNDVLSGDGITANYAIREDNTQAEFGQGTLSGTAATSNLGGDLELALAGSQVQIVESTTSNFGTGTLTNVTAASNSLTSTPTPTIKFQGTESLTQDGNAYFYMQIFSSGSISIVSGRYLVYDIWIDPASPNGECGVDMVFTDGTSLRDASQTFPYFDAQNIPPHPNHNLAGFAVGNWYHRSFLLDNFSGKTISYITVVFEGDASGTYTAYFKNIYEVNSSGTIINTFFNGTFNVNPPKPMQNSGYRSVSCTIVNTYDCTTSNRVSSSYSISSVGILKSSYISWIASQITNMNVQLEYSLDGGNSYTVCKNNAPLPNFPVGLSVSGMSIQFRETFQQLAGASPESNPALTSVICTLVPSYTASKTDIQSEFTTNAQWNAPGMTFNNTQVQATTLTLYQAIREWSAANLSGMTIFGDGATGPSATTISMHCNLKTLWIQTGINMQGDARLDFAGQWADGVIECDVYIDGTSWRPSIIYRSTGWSNYDADYAYAAEFNLNFVNLQRGSNTNASSNGTRTQIASVAISISTASWHHVTIVFQGSSHKIYVDGVLYVNVTDGTYTAQGYIGLRASNTSVSQGYQAQFNNFGVTVVGLTGSWYSPFIDLSSSGSYFSSVVSWQDVSIGSQSTSLIVQSSVDGGSTFQTITNGGPIPNLTAGQSLSGISVQFSVTLTTASASCMPQLQNLVAWVLGSFNSSGTRISPVLSLTPALIAGSTVVNWTAVTPPNTSVVVATSPTGTGSWTNVSNGGPITGITTQPAPTLDTFAVDDHTSYTNTFRTGGSSGTWNFDTSNSRVTINSGASALLLWTAISVSDVDLILDADAINQGGLVWRETSVSNFYELDIFDSASNAGNTNIVQLFKVVANVKTQLGSNIAISFTRGTYKRFHVLMVGTAITVYMDGVQLISTTDASLAGPGLAGMIHVSGAGSNGDSYRNFRIQPQGQSLSGINAYTRVTLTSTDPTATPQLTDLVLAALHPNIGLGALIATANYKRTFVSANADDLSKKSDYYWQILPTKAAIFNPRIEQPAPWILTSNDVLFPDDASPNTLSVENSGDLYRNRMILQGVLTTQSVVETHPGDGSSTSWVLQFPVVGNAPTISVNGQSKTIGLKGIDSGKDFYYALGSTSLAQDAAGTILQPNRDSFTISYTGQDTTEVVRDNTGGFPNTTTQAQYAALTGGAGIVEVVEDVSAQQLTVAAAQAYGDGLLQRYGVIGQTLLCQTNRTGLSVGQYLSVVIPELGLNDVAMLITAMDLKPEITLVGNQVSMLYYWSITAISGPNLGNWQKTLTKILGYNPSSKSY